MPPAAPVIDPARPPHETLRRRYPAPRPRGLAVLGLGEGVSILSAAQTSPFWTTTCVCDLSADLCRERAEAFDVPAVTTDYAALLARDDVEVVAVFTPDPLHADHVAQALEAGKHVVVTKPLLTELTDAPRLLRAQAATGKRVLVGQSSRYFATTLAQRADFDAGHLGDLHAVEAHYHGDKRQGTSGAWAKHGENNWIYTGLIHPVDLVAGYLGPIDTVSAVANFGKVAQDGNYPHPDNFYAVFRDVNGVIGSAAGAYGTPGPPEAAQTSIACTLRGDRGASSAGYQNYRYALRVDGEADVVRDLSDQHEYYFRFGGFHHHAGEFQNYLDHFWACLEEDREPAPGLQEGVRIVAAVAAVELSIATNATVRVPDLLADHGLNPDGSLAG